MKISSFLLGTSFIFLLACTNKQEPPKEQAKPNILLIAIDDLNDWIGCLGGHPQALTPNIDRLAAQGLLFTNAHCQSPVCNPSRASLMTSLYPSTTGIYFLNPEIKKSPVANQSRVMPKRFEQEGYEVLGAGKLFHNAYGQNEAYISNYGGSFGGFGPLPEQKIVPFPGVRLWDWGAYPDQDTLMPDHKIASWAIDRLSDSRSQPFWMGVGFFRPHVPQYVPQKWFDLYPLDRIQLPEILEDDLADISNYGINITRLKHVAPTHEWVLENKEWAKLVQSYLACVSFVDAQVGRVLEALEASPYANNTYVVLWSDHGFHFGEKERYAKRSLWKDGTRVPLIMAGPNIPKNKESHQPVQLLDIYPTLLDLAGLEADSLHEGNSLVPLIEDSDANWPHYARTSFGPGNYAIISEQYRFIQYVDGSEELYDHQKDPYEWYNIIEDNSLSEIVNELRSAIPQKNHEILGEGSTGHLSYEESKN